MQMIQQETRNASELANVPTWRLLKNAGMLSNASQSLGSVMSDIFVVKVTESPSKITRIRSLLRPRMYIYDYALIFRPQILNMSY
jgi:hypothetical protein